MHERVPADPRAVADAQHGGAAGGDVGARADGEGGVGAEQPPRRADTSVAGAGAADELARGARALRAAVRVLGVRRVRVRARGRHVRHGPGGAGVQAARARAARVRGRRLRAGLRVVRRAALPAAARDVRRLPLVRVRARARRRARRRAAPRGVGGGDGGARGRGQVPDGVDVGRAVRAQRVRVAARVLRDEQQVPRAQAAARVRGGRAEGVPGRQRRRARRRV